jgi:hypothetical protein
MKVIDTKVLRVLEGDDYNIWARDKKEQNDLGSWVMRSFITDGFRQ